MEDKIEKSWFEDHTKRFGSDPVAEYEILEFDNDLEKKEHRGHKVKIINIKYKAGKMDKLKRSICAFEQFKSGRWYLGQKP